MAQIICEGPRTPQPPADSSCPQGCPQWGLHDELRDLVVSEVQGEVFAGSFDWESVLDVDALPSQAAVAVETVLLQSMATPEGVTLSSVLTQTCDAQEVFLVQPDVIEAQAVSIGGSLWFPTYCLQDKGRVRRCGDVDCLERSCLWPAERAAAKA